MTDEAGDLTGAEEMVTARDFSRTNDEAFVFATWRKGYYYGARKEDIPPSEFFPQMTAKIKETLSRSDCQIRVACLKGAPEVILGYAVITGDMHLEWAFVKLDFRAKGIARFITTGIKTVSPNLTKIGTAIVRKKRLVIKGDADEQTGTSW